MSQVIFDDGPLAGDNDHFVVEPPPRDSAAKGPAPVVFQTKPLVRRKQRAPARRHSAPDSDDEILSYMTQQVNHEKKKHHKKQNKKQKPRKKHQSDSDSDSDLDMMLSALAKKKPDNAPKSKKGPVIHANDNVFSNNKVYSSDEEMFADHNLVKPKKPTKRIVDDSDDDFPEISESTSKKFKSGGSLADLLGSDFSGDSSDSESEPDPAVLQRRLQKAHDQIEFMKQKGHSFDAKWVRTATVDQLEEEIQRKQRIQRKQTMIKAGKNVLVFVAVFWESVYMNLRAQYDNQWPSAEKWSQSWGSEVHETENDLANLFDLWFADGFTSHPLVNILALMGLSFATYLGQQMFIQTAQQMTGQINEVVKLQPEVAKEIASDIATEVRSQSEKTGENPFQNLMKAFSGGLSDGGLDMRQISQIIQPVAQQFAQTMKDSQSGDTAQSNPIGTAMRALNTMDRRDPARGPLPVPQTPAPPPPVASRRPPQPHTPKRFQMPHQMQRETVPVPAVPTGFATDNPHAEPINRDPPPPKPMSASEPALVSDHENESRSRLFAMAASADERDEDNDPPSPPMVPKKAPNKVLQSKKKT